MSFFLVGFGLKKKLQLNHGNRFFSRSKMSSGSVPQLGNLVEIPKQWYNLVADLQMKPPPPLNPKTLQPLQPEELSPLFPDEIIKQELSDERFIDIPDDVIDIYKLWRPTPLLRSAPFVIFYLCIVSFCIGDQRTLKL